MSVINQMLRDLDARDASAQERAGLPPRLRSLPPTARAKAAQWRTLLLGMGIGALVAGGAVGLLMAGRQAAPPAPLVATAPAAAAPAAAALAAPTPPQPQPVEDGTMKLSTLIAQSASPTPASPTPSSPKAAVPSTPASAPVAAKAPPPPKPPAAAEPPSTPKPVAAVREAKQQAAPAAAETAADAQIDKRSKGGAGREMAEAEYRKGMQVVKRGEAAAALSLFQRAIEFDPTHARARQALLSVLVSGKQWAEARQVAEQGLALDPSQSGWAVILARLQFEQGDAAAATATLERHAAYARNDADFQGLFAYLLQKQQRPAEAAERFKAALSLRPNEGRWWFGLGVALEGAGRGVDARDAYHRAHELGGLSPEMASIVEQKLK